MAEYTADEILEQAKILTATGFSVFPVGEDKIPKAKWGDSITERQDPETWMRNEKSLWDRAGIGIATGRISDVLVFDFDRPEEPALFAEWVEAGRALVEDFDLRVPIIETPSGGLHAYLKVAGGDCRNEKLAMIPTPEGEPELVIFETRGNGGYVVTPGGDARCHEMAKPYVQISGIELEEWATIKPLSMEDIDDLLTAARMYDRRPVATVDEENRELLNPEDKPVSSFMLGRPGDDLEAQREWADLLEPDGWVHDRLGRDGVEYWRRPGKDKGWSATVNFGGFGKLRVFSSSVQGLATDRFYSKFSYVVEYRFAGSATSAVEALRREGLGLAPHFNRNALSGLLANMVTSPMASDIFDGLKVGDPDLRQILKGAGEVGTETTAAKLGAWASRVGASVKILAQLLDVLKIDRVNVSDDASAGAEVIYDKPKAKGKQLLAAKDELLKAEDSPDRRVERAKLAGDDPVKVVAKVLGIQVVRIVAHGQGEGSISVFHYEDGTSVHVANFQDQRSIRSAHLGHVPPIFLKKFKSKDWWGVVDCIALARELGSTIEEEILEAVGSSLSESKPHWHPKLIDDNQMTEAAAMAFNKALRGGKPVMVRRSEDLYVGFGLAWAKDALRGKVPVKGLGVLLREISLNRCQTYQSSSLANGGDDVFQRKIYMVRAEDIGSDAIGEGL